MPLAALSEETLPKPPRTLAESGLGLDLLTPLVLKTLYFSGELTGVEMARRLGLIFAVVEPSLAQLTAQRYCTVVGSGIVGGPSFRYAITTEGRLAATQHLQHDQYVGMAPVPLRQYTQYLEAFGRAARSSREAVDRESLQEALAGLALSERVYDEIGPAIRQGRSMLVYGAPGNGKTAIAQRLHALLPGTIAVPHAIEIDGHIVRVFDPVAHQPCGPASSTTDQLLPRTADLDERWVLCRRPMIAVGAELTVEAMELVYQRKYGCYRAPIQLLANGGLLLVEDFGRQRSATLSLMNRWILPLEAEIDSFTLQSGLRFAVPFLALVVFTTNLQPLELADEAFLRRVQHKVAVEDPSPQDFVAIFEAECRRLEIPFEAPLAERVLTRWYGPRQLPLRGCHPRDLIDRALLLAAYRSEPRRLTPELLDAACANYFALGAAAFEPGI